MQPALVSLQKILSTASEAVALITDMQAPASAAAQRTERRGRDAATLWRHRPKHMSCALGAIAKVFTAARSAYARPARNVSGSLSWSSSTMAPDAAGLQERVAQLEEDLATLRAEVRDGLQRWGKRQVVIASPLLVLQLSQDPP